MLINDWVIYFFVTWFFFYILQPVTYLGTFFCPKYIKCKKFSYLKENYFVNFIYANDKFIVAFDSTDWESFVTLGFPSTPWKAAVTASAQVPEGPDKSNTLRPSALGVETWEMEPCRPIAKYLGMYSVYSKTSILVTSLTAFLLLLSIPDTSYPQCLVCGVQWPQRRKMI